MNEAKKKGPPPISVEKWNEVCDLARGNVPAKVASEQTGLGLTKIYEIYRNPVKREVSHQGAA